MKETFKLAFREFQTTLSIAYVLSVGIGMLFTYQKYTRFGINIFDYADVFDFLLAPFTDPVILFYSIVSIVLTYLFYILDKYWRLKFPKTYSRFSFGTDKKS